MPVEAAIDQTEQADDAQGQEDEIEGKDRVRNEGIECLVGKEIGVIKRIAFLLPRRKAREKDERGGVEKKDRLVRIGGPGKPQHGGPCHPFEARPARHAVGVSRFDIAARNGLQCAVENLA